MRKRKQAAPKGTGPEPFVGFRISEPILSAIDDHAADLGVARSVVIRNALIQYAQLVDLDIDDEVLLAS